MSVNLLEILASVLSIHSLAVVAEEPPSAPLEATLPGIPTQWMNKPPADCPFTISEEYAEIKAGPFITYGFRKVGEEWKKHIYGDTFYFSWGADDACYSIGCDPHKMYKVSGADPLKLGWQVIPSKSFGDFQARHKQAGFKKYYYSASLVHNGIWYMGGESRYGTKGHPHAIGRFYGFWMSNDFGKTWSSDTMPAVGEGLFPEADKYENVRFAVPHFVDFGKNMMHSPDGKAYLTAHGSEKGITDWEQGNEAYLVRVQPSPTTINDVKAYEYFAGYDPAGAAVWSKEFAEIKPMLKWPRKIGNCKITYNAGLKKYLCVVDFARTHRAYDTYILESDAVSGPWRLITYLAAFGPQGYFVNIPSKFISADGLTMWLGFTANWEHPNRNTPAVPNYGACFQEITLVPRK